MLDQRYEKWEWNEYVNYKQEKESAKNVGRVSRCFYPRGNMAAKPPVSASWQCAPISGSFSSSTLCAFKHVLFYFYFTLSGFSVLSHSFVCSPTCASALNSETGNIQCECRKLKLGCGPFPGRKSRERNGMPRHGSLRTWVEYGLVNGHRHSSQSHCVHCYRFGCISCFALRFTDSANPYLPSGISFAAK
jgi:hypothetical protein